MEGTKKIVEVLARESQTLPEIEIHFPVSPSYFVENLEGGGGDKNYSTKDTLSLSHPLEGTDDGRR